MSVFESLIVVGGEQNANQVMSLMGGLGTNGSSSRTATSYICRHGRIHSLKTGGGPALGDMDHTAGYTDPSLVNTQSYTNPTVNQQAYTAPLDSNQGYTSNQEYTTPSQGYTAPSLVNNQGYATPSLVNNQGYTTPSLVNNPGYTTPSLVNNQGYTEGYTTPSLVNNQVYVTPGPGYTTPALVNNTAGYAGVVYHQQPYQPVSQYGPNGGLIQSQSVFHS